ncbi:FlgN protein [Mobilisporobacter senegalensis]|uniref:FlgN protein n=1 Tax=Mobilisporobacter senegalensis TaxID=1329262 RepID=A0A3N1XY63_9FIRM|nr:flagellar export chaperone FlgN [Mobilisporobacter senegalensis]ROR31546.1 FlgN protein [Mobilisporobacter senegalensis]
MDNQNVYINILINTLAKKSAVLDDLIDITLLQESYLKEAPQNMDSFEETLDNKSELINNLDQLDDGFEAVYERVKEELKSKKDLFQNEVLKLQELIRQVTNKGVKLQALEQQNKLKMEAYFLTKKQEIKNFKKSSQTASNYYKSMIDRPQGDSYFLDKKK